MPSGETGDRLTRRAFLGQAAGGLGALALPELFASAAPPGSVAGGSPATLPHFAPRAKRVIYLFQSGGPSTIDLFDAKPWLRKRHGEELPPSVRGGQRLTGMTANQKSLPLRNPEVPLRQHGDCGAWVSDLLPRTAGIVDKLCFVKSLNTEAINHDPAITFINTGDQQIGKPSLGSWLSHGLGSENRDLPGYLVLLSQGTGKSPGQPIFSRLWGSGFLSSAHEGVKLRSGKDPVLFLSDPPGIDRASRRAMLDDLRRLNELRLAETGDSEISARVSQYEMAYRMQSSVPDLVDLHDEPDSTFELYGPDARRPGSYAANCLLARRMAERGVRFVQLFHRGWDQHVNLVDELAAQSRDTDRASAALVADLDRRGLLDDTLVIWGGEFGRTAYGQGKFGDRTSGRDHHGRCFTIWMAGGGLKRGFEFGTTDEFGYNVAENGVHIRDLNATILHLLGIDHRRFTHRFRGLEQRLTGVDEEARVVHEIIA